jgi:hypothetical protein
MKYRLLSHPEKIRKTDEIFHPYECNWFPVPDEYVGGIVKPGVEGLPVRRKLNRTEIICLLFTTKIV